MQANVARSTVNAVLSFVSGEKITSSQSSLSVMGSLGVEVGHLNTATGSEAILSVLTCGFYYTGPVYNQLVGGPSSPLS